MNSFCHPECSGGPGRALRQRPRGSLAALSLALRGGATLAAALCLAACSNMKDQPNVRTGEPSEHFADGMSTRPAPAHTVARDAAEATPFETGFRDGQWVAELPVKLDRPLLERGRERFSIYCAACHGDDGYGSGIVARRGFPAPPSYHDDRLRTIAVGHFFDVITRGYGVMPSYRDRISPRDRWAIAAYIRALQRSQHATPADVPANEQRRLAAR